MIEIPTWTEFIEFFVKALKENPFFQTAGVFGLLGILWQYFRKVPAYIWSRVKRKITYTVTIEQTDEFYEYFERWLSVNHKQTYRNVVANIDEMNEVTEGPEASQDDAEDQKIPVRLKYRQFEDLFFVRRGLVLIKILKGREKLENANSLMSAYFDRFKLSGLFAKRAIEKIMKEVLEYNIEYLESKKNFSVKVHFNNNDYWNCVNDITPKLIENIVVDGKDELIKDFDNYINSKEWYRRRSIIYKRGYMFDGAPGNGKTVLALGLAMKYKRNIYMLNSKRVDDKELISLFSHISKGSILLIEDIDSIFGKKRNEKTSKFNFSTLLNCLDGAFAKDDVVTIFTTNHPERLDEALIREGRVDFKLTIGNPNVWRIQEYFEIFFDEKINLVGFKNKEVSMVKIQDICLRNKASYKQAAIEIKKVLIKDAVQLNGQSAKKPILSHIG